MTKLDKESKVVLSMTIGVLALTMIIMIVSECHQRQLEHEAAQLLSFNRPHRPKPRPRIPIRTKPYVKYCEQVRLGQIMPKIGPSNLTLSADVLAYFKRYPLAPIRVEWTEDGTEYANCFPPIRKWWTNPE